jgi:nitroimidazol reductase NimA-like FMN-containing flavoprotein (pyridoxamine 5'-phosphate oxidase superfamily)
MSDAGAVWVDDLELDVCWKLIGAQRVGRVGFVLDGEALIVPVNHAVDGRTIVFRTGATALLEGVAGGSAMAFEVDGIDTSAETGWSVLVRGEAREVTDEQERVWLARLPLNPWAPGERDRWLRVVPTSVTGRAISRPRARRATSAGLPTPTG